MRERLAALEQVAREALREDNLADGFGAERTLALRAALMRVVVLAAGAAADPPARRPVESCSVDWRGRALTVTVGFRPGTRAAVEVAVRGWQAGSDLQALAEDACCVISSALQRGVAAGDLRRLTGTAPDPAAGGAERPVSIIGAVLEAVERLEQGA